MQPAPEAAETTPPPAEQPEPGTADALGLFENDVASFAYPAGMEWDKQVGEDGTQYRFTPSVPGPGQVAEIRFSIFEGSYLELDAAPDAVQQQLEWNNGYLWDSAELEALQKTEIEGRPARWKTIRYEKDGTDYIEMTLELLDGGRGTAVEITALLEDRDHCEKAADTLDFHFAEPYLPYGRVAEFDTELWVMADMPEQCSWMRIEPQSQEDPIQGMEVYFPGGDTILQLWSQGNPARMPADLQTLATCAGMNGGTWHVLALPDDAAPQDELLLFLTGAGADTPPCHRPGAGGAGSDRKRSARGGHHAGKPDRHPQVTPHTKKKGRSV